MVSADEQRGRGRRASLQLLKGSAICGIGTFIFVASIQSIAGYFLGKLAGWTALLGIPNMVFGVSLVIRGNRILREAGRLLAPTIMSAAELGSGPIFLYLRPFERDMDLDSDQPISIFINAMRAIFTIAKSEEQHIAEAIAGRQGRKIVAAARPGEKSPQIGAIRVRLNDENWQDQVRDLLLRAERVALVIGATSGTLWELTESMRILRPEQLLLIVAMDKDDYRSFKRVAEDYITQYLMRSGIDMTSRPPHLLPPYFRACEMRTKVRGVIHFTQSWTPKYRPLRRYSPLYSSLRGMLLRAIPSIDGHSKRSYVLPPPLTLIASGLLALTGGALYLVDVVSTNTIESFVLGLNGISLQFVTSVIVAVCLLRGTPHSDIAAGAYFLVTMWWTVILDRASFDAALANHDILFTLRNVAIPALGLLLLISRSARSYYAD